MQIQSFDSMEQMQEAMASAEAAANAGLRPDQVTLRDDRQRPAHWVRVFPEAGCLIFGEAWSDVQTFEASAKYVPARPTADGLGPTDYDGSDQEYVEEYESALDQAADEIRTTLDSRERGYMMGEAWSVMEERGELGSTHVANAFPISAEAFAEARAAGWQAVKFMGAENATDDELRALGGTPVLCRELEALTQ